MSLVVEWSAPIRTRNPLNADTRHSKLASVLTSREDRAQRDAARLQTWAALRRHDVRLEALLPCLVTVTRLSSGKLDAHDGLPAALKRIVDGVALALGIDDGDDAVRWMYAQERCPRGQYAVRVKLEARNIDVYPVK